MNKLFFYGALLLLAPAAFAKSVTIEVSDEVSYRSLRTYNDGITIVEEPKMYGYYLGASSRDSSEANARVLCQRLMMSYHDDSSTSFMDHVNTVSFSIGSNGEVSLPRFSYGRYVLKRVICRR